MIRSFIIGFMLLVGATFSYAQSFTLNATPTAETCFGNGTISVSVDGVVSGADVDYVLYKMPDQTNPVATAAGQAPPNYPFTFDGLTTGEYKIVATQNYGGGQSSSEERFETIIDNKNPVTPQTTDVMHTILCGNDGVININLMQGDVTTYELLKQQPDGTFLQVFPPQAMPFFSGLDPGVYVISMIDALCGNTVNMTYTITGVTLGDVEFLGYQLKPNFGNDCAASTVTVAQAIQVPLEAFPIIVTFIVEPPGGGLPIEQTQIINGPPLPSPSLVRVTVNENIPYFPGTYFFSVTVTNACGTLYFFDSGQQPVFFEMSVSVKIAEEICHGIDVSVENFLGGFYEVIFLEYPPLFEPRQNPDPGTPLPHEGPFSDPKVTFGEFNFYQLDGLGNFVLDGDGNKIPELTGHYKILVKDGCGNEIEFEFDIADEIQEPNIFAVPVPPLPNATVPFLDCIDRGNLFIQHEINIAEVYIIDGPADFQTFLTDHANLPAASSTDPIDISAYIAFPSPNAPYTQLMFDGSGGELTAYSEVFPLVGLGVYKIKIIDVCDNEFIIDVNLGSYFAQNAQFTIEISPGCDGKSGFDMVSVLDEGSGVITGVIVLDAPAEFYTEFSFLENPPGSGIYDALPYKYSVLNNDPTLPLIGHIMMGGLPPGHYEFDIRVSCAYSTFSFDLPVYNQTTDIDVTVGCGVFDFEFIHTANNTGNFPDFEVFFLDVFDPQTNTWEEIRNDFKGGDIVYNINVQGQFRIRKQYSTYFNDILGGGGPVAMLCQEILHEFEVINTPGIQDIYSISCSTGGSEAIVVADGIQPLSYYIVDDNGTILVNNGQSNVFVNLAPGTYRFMVEDNCGSSEFGVHQLEDPIPFDIDSTAICDGQTGSIFVQCYSIFSYEWYKVENGTETSVGTGCELKFDPFDVNNDSGTYKVKITYTAAPTSCANLELTYEVSPTTPNAGDDQNVNLCHADQTIDLFDILVQPYDAGGTWEDTSSTGALTGSTFNTQGIALGTYTFRYFLSECSGSDEAFVTITLSEAPALPVIMDVNALCEGEEFKLIVDNPNSQYTYTWSGPNGQSYTGPEVTIPNSTLQNDGVYSVVATLGNCSSPAGTTSVDIIPLVPLNAGADQNVNLCHTDQTIDLFSILVQPYDVGGIWEDTSSTGALTGNTFDTQGIALGTYTFRYFLSNGCTSDESFVTITLSEVPTLPVITQIPTLCEGEDLQLTIDTPNGQYTYTWTAPNGQTYTGSNVTISGTTQQDAGTYTVVASLANCSSPVANVQVDMNIIPVFSVIGDTEICVGSQHVLIPSSELFVEPDATYEWLLNGSVVGTDMTLTIDDIGNYMVTATLNGCEHTASINVIEKFAADVSLEANCDAQNRFSIEVANVNDFPGATFQWTDPNGSNAGSDTSIALTGTSPLGVYTINVTNPDGCKSTQSIDITSIDCMIPKGITPNGDGMNDSFDLSNYDVSQVKIFNRYGREVYAASNYTNEWHGQRSDSDKLLPSATYYYIVTFVDGTKRTGWVYLNREE